MIIENLAKRVRVQRGLRCFHNKKKQTKANSGIWVPSGNKNGLICSRRDARARERERFHGFLFPKEVLIREALALEVIPPRSLGANLAGGHSASCFLFRDGTDGH